MAFNYAALSSTASNLIGNFGQSVTFTRIAVTGYNPASGSSSSTSTYTANIVLFSQIKNEDGETTTEVKEFPASMYSATEPKINDTVTINSQKLRIMEVTPLQPASEVIYYDVRLRG